MTKTPATIAQRRLESAIHESAHFVASVLHGAAILAVHILPKSGQAIDIPGNPDFKCEGYVTSYVDSPYNDGFIDLCGCAINILRGAPESLADYNAAKRVVPDEQFRQCEEDAGIFVYTHRRLIEQVGRELFAIAKSDGMVTTKSREHLESYTKFLLRLRHEAAKTWADSILAEREPTLTELRRRYAEAA